VTGAKDLRSALDDGAERAGLVAAMRRAHEIAPGRASLLRPAVESLAATLTETLAAAGLPIIETDDDEVVWALVEPVSRALRQARATVEGEGRSARRLDAARQALLGASAALVDPDGQRARPALYGPRHLRWWFPAPTVAYLLASSTASSRREPARCDGIRRAGRGARSCDRW